MQRGKVTEGVSVKAGTPLELYNLKEDVGETNNLAGLSGKSSPFYTGDEGYAHSFAQLAPGR